MTKDMYKADGIQTMIPTKPPEKETQVQGPGTDVRESGPVSGNENTYRKPPLYEPEFQNSVPARKSENIFRSNDGRSGTYQNSPNMFQQGPPDHINNDNLQQGPHQDTEHKKKDGIAGIIKRLFSNFKGKSLAERMDGMQQDTGYQHTYQPQFNAQRTQHGPAPSDDYNINLEDISNIVEKQVREAIRNSASRNQQVQPDIDIENLKRQIDSTANRFTDIEERIGNLSTTMETIGSDPGMDEKGHELEERISKGFESSKERMNIIEDRVSYFETAINSIQSDNDDLKRGLENIENNISELTGSYSSLLSIIEESTTATDSRMNDIWEKVERMTSLEPRLAGMEVELAVSSQSVSDIGKTISVIMEDIAENYSSTESIRSQTKEDIEAIQQKMETVTKHMEEELKKVGSRGFISGGGDVQLTYIEKNTSSMKICMEWLEMLMELVGRNNLPDLLSYYEELGWISDEIRFELLRYADGIDYYLEKPDWKLNPSDHVKSIWFIEKLAGSRVDKNQLSIIDKDIEKVKKGTEKIYGL